MSKTKGWVALLTGALSLASCGGHGNMCPVPPGVSEPATLHIVHEHDFPDKSYEETDVTYKVGDCVLIRNTDARLLTQKVADLGTHAVLPGTTEIQLTTTFESSFAADMHHYRWGNRVPFQIEISPGSKVELRVRYHEVWSEDPRARMKIDVKVDDQVIVKSY